jgi:curved DNA-binding protein CbpA
MLRRPYNYIGNNSRYIFPISYYSFRANSTKSQLLYSLLCVEKNSTRDEIKKAYKKMCLKYHPDISPGDYIKFIEITKAYDIIGKNDSKKDYDSMTEKEHDIFVNFWKIQYYDKKKVHDINNFVDKYANDISIKSNIIKKIGYCISSYYEKQIYVKEKENEKEYYSIDNNSNHLYFLLDNSSSMHCIESNDFTREVFYDMKKSSIYVDGKWMTRCGVSSNPFVREALDNYKSITQTIKNTKKILSQLNDEENKYIASIAMFSESYNIIAEEKSLPELINKDLSSKSRALYNYKDGTHIYSSLMKIIERVEKFGNLTTTTFILFTDGKDTGNIKLEEMIKYIKEKKCMRLIIMTLNLNEYDNSILKKLVDAAKFGKLLKIGDKLDGFLNIETAFTETKNIILTNYNDNHQDKSDFKFNPRDKFDF